MAYIMPAPSGLIAGGCARCGLYFQLTMPDYLNSQ